MRDALSKCYVDQHPSDSMSDILISNFLNEYFFSFSPNQKRSCHVSSHVSIQVYSNINIFEGTNTKSCCQVFSFPVDIKSES